MPSTNACKDFNPRSREGSDLSVLGRLEWLWYFNPRSREGSDLVWPCLGHFQPISIHAPVKGATSVKRLLESVIGISIHAPVKGATCRDKHV